MTTTRTTFLGRPCRVRPGARGSRSPCWMLMTESSSGVSQIRLIEPSSFSTAVRLCGAVGDRPPTYRTTKGFRRLGPARSWMVSYRILSRHSRPAPPRSTIGALEDNCRPPRPHLLELSLDRRAPMPLAPCSNANAVSQRWIRA